jgi:hypothetical protein
MNKSEETKGDLVIPSSLQSVAGLGEPERVYTQSRSSKVVNAIACACVLLLAIGTGFWGLVIYPQVFPAVAQTNVPCILGFAILVLLGALYWALRIIFRRSKAVVVYYDGFAYFDGKKARTFRWSEIASITMNVVQMSYYGAIPAGTMHNYTIVDQAGTKLKLDNTLSGVGKLFDCIREETWVHLPNCEHRCSPYATTGTVA